jgi:hypothetical protein
MTKVFKKSNSRIARWFKSITTRKTPYRWYDVENCGM